MINDGSGKRSNISNAEISDYFKFEKYEATAKFHNLTVTNLTIAGIIIALHNYMRKLGDHTTKTAHMVLPMNLRLQFYDSFESVVFENKNSAILKKVPITNDLDAIKNRLNFLKKPSIVAMFASFY